MKTKFILEIEESLIDDIRHQIGDEVLPSKFIITAIENALNNDVFIDNVEDYPDSFTSAEQEQTNEQSN